MKKLITCVLLGLATLTASVCSAYVPHSVNKYKFHIELPDGFTKVVVEETPYQHIYDSYHGNHTDKSFVRIHIQKEDSIRDWDKDRLQKQLSNTINIYKAQGAEIISTDIIDLTRGKALVIHSQHDGKQHLTLQTYRNSTMYIVTCTFDSRDKNGLPQFTPMLKSVKC